MKTLLKAVDKVERNPELTKIFRKEFASDFDFIREAIKGNLIKESAKELLLTLANGEVTFNFLTEKGNHPQEDDFLLADEENLNDIKLSDDGLNMLGEWQEPEEATISNIKKFRNAIRENIS